MAYLNKVFLIGNLTRDPEFRVTPKGTAIAAFGLAVNRQYKAEDGTARDETTFVDIEAWAEQADGLRAMARAANDGRILVECPACKARFGIITDAAKSA